MSESGGARSAGPTSDACMVLVARRNAEGGVTDFEIRDANELALLLHGSDGIVGTTVRTLFPRQQAEELIETCEQVCASRRPLRAADFACAPEPIGRAAPAWDVRVVPIDDGVVFHWRASEHTDPRTFVLAETERRYRLLAENASDIVCLTDSDDRVVWVSPSVERRLGYRATDLIGSNVARIIDPADLGRVLATRNRVFTGSSETLELRVHDVAGATVWVSCLAHPLIEDGRMVGAVLGIRDIDDEMAVRAELRQSQQRYREAAEQYRQLVESASDAVMRTRDGVILWSSSPITEILGYTPDELVGRVTDDIIHPEDLDELRLGRSNVSTGLEVGRRFRALTRDGQYRWIEVRARPYRAPDGTIDGVVSVIRPVDEDMAERSALEYDATHDPLTGLPNRTSAVGLLDALRLRTPRTGHDTAVLFCDIDRFKDVNDTWGHAAGDAVLTATAQRMSAVIRSGDLVARIGGDELLVVLDGVHGLDDAVVMATRLREAVAQPIEAGGRSIAVTLSIGVAVAKGDDSVAQLLERADGALYEAKRSGRDRIEVAP